MADLGERLWRHPDDGKKTAATRLVTLKSTQCESKDNCPKRATTRIECHDRIGHPILSRDLCDDHARPLIAKAQARGVEVFWHDEPAGRNDRPTERAPRGAERSELRKLGER
jgi:hypothetical protein